MEVEKEEELIEVEVDVLKLNQEDKVEVKMTDMKKTTIQIEREVREALKKKKVYRRDTYNDIIKRALKGMKK